MASGAAFVDILDDTLQGVNGAAPLPGEPFAPASRVATLPFFLFEQRVASRPAPPRANAERPEAPRPRPRRSLTDRQRQALASLIELGARIDEQFTADELRSVSRWLALRYHPDRHPGAGRAEASGLAERFATARAACELLKTVPEVVH